MTTKQADQMPEAAVDTKLTELIYETEPDTDVLERPFHVDSQELSTNFFWTIGKTEIFNLQTSVRGNPTLAEIQANVQAAVAAMKHIVELGGHAKPVGHQASQPLVANAVAPPVPGNGAGPVPVASSQQPAASGEAKCAMIEIGTAYKSGKTQLKFHCDGMDHPLTYTREVSDMEKLLSPLGFTHQHIQIGLKYPVKAVVAWEQVDKYKNVVGVRPA